VGSVRAKTRCSTECGGGDWCGRRGLVWARDAVCLVGLGLTLNELGFDVGTIARNRVFSPFGKCYDKIILVMLITF
jgi:hypothetical protein